MINESTGDTVGHVAMHTSGPTLVFSGGDQECGVGKKIPNPTPGTLQTPTPGSAPDSDPDP